MKLLRSTLISALLFFFFCNPSFAEIKTEIIFSAKMKKQIPVIVVLPESIKKQTKKYPAVYLLHGYSGNYKNWKDHTDLQKYADQFDFVIICPDGSTNSWYIDSPIDKNSQYDTFISSELVKYIDSNYPTIPAKKGRAITGLSMGGHGSLYLALKHPDSYIAAGSMSGGVDLTYNTNKWNIADKIGDYEKSPELWHSNSVINLIENLNKNELALIIDCGVDDFFIEINRNLHKKLLKLNIPHDYYERPGKHSWAYWNRVLEYHLLFFKESFNKQGISTNKRTK